MKSVLPGLAMAILAVAGCRSDSSKTGSGGSKALCRTVPASSGQGATKTASSSKPDLKKARKLYNEGDRYFAKGRPGKPNSNKNLQEACKRFRAARAIYQEALKADPKGQKLEEMIRKCNVKIHSCLKMQTL